MTFIYFIHSKDPFSGRSKKCKKAKETRIVCDDHFLWSMIANHADKTYSVITAECRPSIRYLVKIDGKNYDHYSIHITLIKAGQIENSS